MRARDNPFATARVHQIRYRFDGWGWEEFLDQLAAENYRGAIVGPEGSGKTTLLEDLHPRLASRGFSIINLRLTQDEPRFAQSFLRKLSRSLNPKVILLLDGAEQMSFMAWWMFRWKSRHAGGLIVTAHRPGLLKTVLTCRTTATLLNEIVTDLLGKPADQEQLEMLFQKHRGNVRDALRALYDLQAMTTQPTAKAAARPIDEKEHLFQSSTRVKAARD